jgi:hypothetical protein
MRLNIIAAWVESHANVPVGAAVWRPDSVHPPPQREIICDQRIRPNSSKGS